jgi:hypothetical protein
MKKSKKTNALRSNMTVNGSMTFAKNDNNLNILNFDCTEEGVEIAPYIGKFKVQVMCDGDVYISEMKKRIRNKPLMRTDNASLSKGHDKRYYFIFSMAEAQMDELPDELAYQAMVIANRFEEKYIQKKGRGGK